MDRSLCEAAITGNIPSLHELIKNDPLLLDTVAAGCFNASPLHVAASNKQLPFVEELLRRKPELTEVLDSQLRSALHLASAKGHDEVVRALVKANPDMCLVRDRDGKNPIHLAATKGQIDVLRELVEACPQAARERVDRNETILHLCIKHKQLESLEVLLKTIQGEELVNAKDNDGNTILHLAILDKRHEISTLVLDNQTIDVNMENATGQTAMDILIRVEARSEKKYSSIEEVTQDLNCIAQHKEKEKDLEHIKDLLRRANSKRGKDLVHGQWLKKKRSSLMVVASLIATMAFQAGVSPPGGVWQDNSDGPNGHRAGEAVMAYNYQDSYPWFLRFNTIGFVASLTTILLLISGLRFKNKAAMWVLTVSMWLAITSMAITYAFSNVVITPKTGRRPVTNTIVIAVIVWSSVMTLLLIRHTCHLVATFVEEERSRKSATRRIEEFKRIMGNKQESLSKGWCTVRKRLGLGDGSDGSSTLRRRLGTGDGGANSALPITTETKG